MAKLSPRIIRSVLEVERKFTPASNFVRLLEANSGPPTLIKLRNLGQSTFQDTYYDHCWHLVSQGIWLRQREKTWQAKVRLGGDFLNSQFKEVQGVDEIRVLVQKYTSCTGSEADGFGLSPFASFRTYRHTWTVEGKFKIVLDRMCFGHVVGEVELEQDIPESGVTPEEEQKLSKQMDLDLESFIDRYPWAFSDEKPIGKLSAYLKRQHRQHKVE